MEVSMQEKINNIMAIEEEARLLAEASEMARNNLRKEIARDSEALVQKIKIDCGKKRQQIRNREIDEENEEIVSIKSSAERALNRMEDEYKAHANDWEDMIYSQILTGQHHG